VSVQGASVDHERRTSPRRRRVAEHGIETARVRPGGEASVLDVSTGGILIETMHRLLPGTTIELQLWLADRRTSIRGHVLRSTVASLRRGPVLYRGAIAFERPLAPFPHIDGYAVPRPNATENRHGREDATPPTL
jgi:hypothetical protein